MGGSSGLQGLIDIAFYAVVALALSIAGFFFVMGVINYMGAGGDQQKVQQGVAGMRNALIGAVLIGGASLIINFVVLDIVRPAGGDVGTIGQGLNCDALLQQQLIASPLATANVNNANAIVVSIHQQRGDDCPADSWNPEIDSVATATDAFPVNVPLSLTVANADPDKDTAFRTNPIRGGNGDVGVNFKTDLTATHTYGGSKITLPLNQAKRWMYIASAGTWYYAN